MIILDRQHPIRNPDGPAIVQEVDKTIVVADFEFRRDLEKHSAYVRRDGPSAYPTARWAFDEIVCGSWVVIRFPAGEVEKPEVGRFHSLCQPDMDEIDIADHFFRQVLERHVDGNGDPARFVTWGGDYKDNEVLRRVAMCWGVTVPPQLRNTAENCPLRLDLCQDCYTDEIKGLHLSEYAFAQGLPGKAIPARQVTKHVLAGDWKRVEEQCAGDVLLTAILAVRRLATCGEIGQTGKACTRALVDRFCERKPTDYTRMWARWRKENLGHREILTLCRR